MIRRNRFASSTDFSKTLKQNSFVLRVAVASEFSIDRYEIIYSADLDAVPRVVYDRDIGVDGRIFEIADRALKFQIPNVIRCHDDVKTSVPEKFGHSRCVLFRIGQPGDILIGGIADNQGDALVGKCGIGPKGQNQNPCDSGRKRQRWQISRHPFGLTESTNSRGVDPSRISYDTKTPNLVTLEK